MDPALFIMHSRQDSMIEKVMNYNTNKWTLSWEAKNASGDLLVSCISKVEPVRGLWQEFT